MPMRLILDFKQMGITKTTEAYGYYMESMFFTMLGRVKPSFSSLQHKDIRTRSFALSKASAEEKCFRIHVSTLDDDFAWIVRQDFGRFTGEVFRLKDATLQFLGFTIERDESTKELCERAASFRLNSGFSLHFLTPTAIKHTNKLKHREEFYPQPQLGRLLSGLARREKQWIIEKVPDLKQCFEKLERKEYPTVFDHIEEKVRPISFDIKTRPLPFENSKDQNGCTGFCQYALTYPLDDTEQEILKLLLAMIPYTGLGAKTAMGMGVVEVSIGKIPR